MKEVFYWALKQYCRVALWFYFSRWQIVNKKNVPDGPVIFVANHQNAFLDAVVACCSSHRSMWFLARANVFEKPWARKILSWLKMMPVFRFRDGFNTLRRNDETIAECLALLSRGESILVFAEGNHHDHWRLRPLQKGFARIALAAEEKNNWKLGVKIVPIGIQYENPSESKSRVLVSFGQSVSVKDSVQFSETQPDQLSDLITETTEKLKRLILHIEEEDYHSKIIYLEKYRIHSTDLQEQLILNQALINSYTKEEDADSFLRKKGWFNPLYAYWLLNNIIPWLIIQWVLKNKMKDPQFTSSLKFALGMILVPVFTILQTALVFYVTQSWPIAALYFLSLPASVKLFGKFL